MKFKEGICVYRRVCKFIDDEEFNFDSWVKIEENIKSHLNYLYNSDDIKKILFFDVNNNKLREQNYNYPIIVCSVEEKYDTVFQEEYTLEEFAIVHNKEELDNIKAEIKYLFEFKDNIIEEVIAEMKKEQEEFEKYLMRPEYFSGDIIITDPCYIIPSSIKNEVGYYHLEEVGFTKYLCHSTLYGDWSCHTFNRDTKEILGEFCADAGMVGVFLKDEVLKLYPNFEKDYRSHCYTLIKDFQGTVQFQMLDESTIIVKGKGNINFETRQTGL